MDANRDADGSQDYRDEGLPHRLATLEGRVRELQRQNRTWQVGALASMLLVGTGLVVGAARPSKVEDFDSVRAKKFVLLDSQGRERGIWENGVEGRDTTRLVFLNPEGKRQCNLRSDYSGEGYSSASLSMHRTNDDSIANASMHTSGDGSGVFFQENGADDFGFVSMNYGSGRANLLLMDRERKHLAWTSVAEDFTEFELNDRSTEASAHISLPVAPRTGPDRRKPEIPKGLRPVGRRGEEGQRSGQESRSR